MRIINLTLLSTLLFCGLTHKMKAQERVEYSMTIQELADSLMINNIQLKIAKSSVEVADARVGDVKTNRLPDIGAEMIGMYLSDVNLYDNHWSHIQRVNVPNFGHQFNVSASQLIYGGGRVNKAIALAEMSKSLSESQLKDTDQSIKLNATELYLNLHNLQNQKRILENNKKLANERVKNAKLFYNEDMISKNEVLRAEVLERQLEQSLIQVNNAIEVTNKNLILFVGIDDKILIKPNVSNINHQVSSQNENFYLQKAFENNPQMKMSETQIEIAEKNLELTKADKLPTLAGFAGYNATRPMTSTTPALDYYSNNYQVGLNLSYNIESLFKNKKKALIDEELIIQAELRQEAVEQQIEADVNSAYNNYRQSVKQKEVSLINEEAATENYRITKLKYDNQLVTITEIIDASNTKLQAELQTIDDETAIILNYVRLLRVTGQL